MSNTIVSETVTSHRVGSQSPRLSLSLQMLVENTRLFLVLLTSCQSGSCEPFLGFDSSSLVSVAVMKFRASLVAVLFKTCIGKNFAQRCSGSIDLAPRIKRRGPVKVKRLFFFFFFFFSDSLLDKKEKNEIHRFCSTLMPTLIFSHFSVSLLI